MATPFLPRTDGDLVLWFNNFQTKLSGYLATFGLTASETAAVTNDYNALAYMVNMAEAIKTQQQDRVGFKDVLRDGPIGAVGGPYPGAYTPPTAPTVVVAPGILPRLRLLVKRLKAHAAYTVAIGEDLGIVAPALAPLGVPKPTGSARAVAGSEVTIKFVKKQFTGVLVESRRGAETAWTNLGIFPRSPLLDNRAPIEAGQPEIRSYRLRYVQGNNPVGDLSDTLTVTTIP